MSRRLADTLRYERWAALGMLGPLGLFTLTRAAPALFFGGAATGLAALSVLLTAPVAVFALRIAAKPVRLVEAVATTSAAGLAVTASGVLIAPGVFGLGAAATLRALGLFALASAMSLASAILLEKRRLRRR